MNILMVLERDFPPDLRVENEIKGLIEQNHQVVLACYSQKQEENLVVSDWNGCKVYKNKISKLTYKSSIGVLKFPGYFRFWKKLLTHILEKESINAIHIHDLPLAQLGCEIKKKHNIKFTLDLHENWPAYLRVSKHANTLIGKLISSNNQWEAYEKKNCFCADHVIVVVDEAKERLMKLGIDPKKIDVVSNYPELSDFEGLSTAPKEVDKLVLFYAGGIAEHRGLQFIIQSLPQVINTYPNIELRIFGQGNYVEYLKGLSADLHVSDHVIFYGQVPYKIVLEELSKADITLIPHSKNDHTDSTIPHKLFQYIFAGKPVLASNCDPIERILNESNAGKVYEWNNPDDAAKKLDWIVKNYRYFQAEQLKGVIEKNYNWENEKVKLQNIYSR